MQVTPIDDENNLFAVSDVFSDDLVEKVLSTPWQQLDWIRQEGQENWARRRIKDSELTWLSQWDQELSLRWPSMEQQLGIELHPYYGTAFWLDEPGFTCSMHTDGELPGSLHLTWIGPGTTFYWYKDPSAVRYQVMPKPNSGYIMINRADSAGYRKLLWHAMLEPSQSFRITSYTWINPK